MFQITLESARECCGYSIEYVAKICNIQVKKMKRIEEDPGEENRQLIKKILGVYGVPFDMIYIGRKEDCIKNNQTF